MTDREPSPLTFGPDGCKITMEPAWYVQTDSSRQWVKGEETVVLTKKEKSVAGDAENILSVDRRTPVYIIVTVELRGDISVQDFLHIVNNNLETKDKVVSTAHKQITVIERVSNKFGTTTKTTDKLGEKTTHDEYRALRFSWPHIKEGSNPMLMHQLKVTSSTRIKLKLDEKALPSSEYSTLKGRLVVSVKLGQHTFPLLQCATTRSTAEKKRHAGALALTQLSYQALQAENEHLKAQNQRLLSMNAQLQRQVQQLLHHLQSQVMTQGGTFTMHRQSIEVHRDKRHKPGHPISIAGGSASSSASRQLGASLCDRTRALKL